MHTKKVREENCAGGENWEDVKHHQEAQCRHKKKIRGKFFVQKSGKKTCVCVLERERERER